MEQRPVFDDLANVYDSWFLTPTGRKVFELELCLLLETLNPLSGASMLDVGIGTGLFATEFRERGAKVEGIDLSPKMLGIATKRGFKVQYGVGEAIPYADNTFDIVFAMTSIEFSRTRDLFVREMARVAKSNGRIVVGVLNLWSFYGISRRFRGLFKKNLFSEAHFYTYRELKKLLLRYLSDVSVNSSVFITPSSPKIILNEADFLESFGRRHLAPFGALLVGVGRKS